MLAFTRLGGWGFVTEGLRLNVAISRSCDHFVLVCDLAALNPSDRHREQLDQLDSEEREERDRIERELGRNIRNLFSYFEKKGMVSLVKAEALDEISLVDMTPVTEFRRRNACQNCQQMGHRAGQCPNPTVENITCHTCGEVGHQCSECPDKVVNMTCYSCGGKGHRKQQCPRAECKRCGGKGHTVIVCEQPDLRVCGTCKEQGHLSKNCPDKKKKRRWILADESRKTLETIEAIDAETAGTQEPVSMPAMTKGWENLEVEDNELDPTALAKSLAQSDMVDDDDEDETQGKGKGKMV